MVVRGAALTCIVWLGMLVGLVGCAHAPDRRAEEATLRQRAHARWEAIVAGDFAKVQEFYPIDLRATYTPERLQQEYAIQAKRERFEIVGVYFPINEPDRATVVVKQWFDTQGTVAGFAAESVGTHDELWEKRDGEWWFIRLR